MSHKPNGLFWFESTIVLFCSPGTDFVLGGYFNPLVAIPWMKTFWARKKTIIPGRIKQRRGHEEGEGGASVLALVGLEDKKVLEVPIRAYGYREGH